MRVILATSVVPFAEGNSAQVAAALHRELQAGGHEVEMLEFPFMESSPQILDQLLALRLLDLSQFGDRMIALGRPSHLLKHPNKVAWFLSHSQGGGLGETKDERLRNTPEGLACRRAVLNSEGLALRECTRVFCNSTEAKDRLRELHGIEAEVLGPQLSGEAAKQLVKEPGFDWNPVIARLLA
jgi:hypothetical protein